jgi:CTP synthase
LEYAKNVLKLKSVSTEEIDPKAEHLVVGIMDEQREKIAKKDMGGTMRLGEYQAVLKKGSLAARAYKATDIVERHRHRYEISPQYIEQIEKAGLIFTGKSPNGQLMEIAELPTTTHPFFLGVQFHPELIARPLAPHALFTAFVKASYESR